MSDADLIASLHGLGGTPAEILAEPALMDFVLPMLRADFSANEACPPERGQPAAFPLTLFAAHHDAEVGIQKVWAWEECVTVACRRVLLEGDHFSAMRTPQSTISEICSDLAMQHDP